jgi:hypothetical protein
MLLCLGLSGCAGMHLYSEKRDQQGKDLQAAWAKVDLDGYFLTMQEQRKKMLQSNLDAIGIAGTARTNARLSGLAAKPVISRSPGVVSFVDLIDGELDQLGKNLGNASFRKPISDYQTLIRNMAGNRGDQAAYRKIIAADSVAPPPCPANGFAPEARLQEYWTIIGNLCRDEATFPRERDEAIAKLPDGVLKETGRRLTMLDQTYASASSEADRMMAEYRAALDEYSAAVRANGADPLPSARLSAAGAKARRMLAALTAVDNLLGIEAASKERLARIDGILAEVGTTKDPGAEATRAELASVLVTRIADDVHVLAELNKPIVPVSLQIQRELDKNSADLARLQAELYRTDIALVREEQALQVSEAMELQDARDLLVVPGRCFGEQNFVDAMALAHPQAGSGCDDVKGRKNLFDAAGRYLYAVGPLHAQTQQIQHRQVAIKRERQLAYAKANAKQWAVLIDATAGQAVAYASSGQKASNYTDLIQSILLLGTAYGVNK